MKDNIYLTSALLCYLTPEAKRVYSQLTEDCGVDPDLAMTLLEKFFQDREMYELGESSNG